jgi:YD repeat-containing protein
VWVYLRGGGREIFVGPPDGTGAYPAHWRVRAQLVRVSTAPIRYERRLPDGGVEVYGLPDAAPVGQRRVFLTEVRDPHGAALTLTYDAQYRLVALTDALGQVTTLTYGWGADPLKITVVTDPFGRTAQFSYTPDGQLASITDVLGLTSSMAYQPNDFVAALTTPYGTTTFRHEGTDPASHPSIERVSGGPTRRCTRRRLARSSAGAGERRSLDGQKTDWAAERATSFGTRLTLTAADKRDIVRLAAVFGLTSPTKVVVDHWLPTLCEFVRVDSEVRPEGNHRAWLELRMRPREWRACLP